MQLDLTVGARTIQLHEEDALPRAQLEHTVDDRDRSARAQQQVQAVRVAIGSLVRMHVLGAHTEIVVTVWCVWQARGPGFESPMLHPLLLNSELALDTREC